MSQTSKPDDGSVTVRDRPLEDWERMPYCIRGQKPLLADVPLAYWRHFLQQDWKTKWRGLPEYAAKRLAANPNQKPVNIGGPHRIAEKSKLWGR